MQKKVLSVFSAVMSLVIIFASAFVAYPAGSQASSDVAAAPTVQQNAGESDASGADSGTPAAESELSKAQVESVLALYPELAEYLDDESSPKTVSELEAQINTLTAETQKILDGKAVLNGGKNHGSFFVTEFGGQTVDLLSLKGILTALKTIKSLNGFVALGAAYLNGVADTLFQVIADLFPTKASMQYLDEYKTENFYSGHETFAKEASKSAVWSMGYDRQLLTPDDFDEKAYYKGGSGSLTGLGIEFTGKYDDLYVRTVCIDDGRGKVVFAVIDTVGLANTDVRKIRAELADFAKANNIVSINVSATHTHSGIDTQGAWSFVGLMMADFVPTFSSLILNGWDSVPGTDPEYMDFMTKQTVKSIKNACNNMTTGDLYFATKDTLNEDGVAKYFYARSIPSEPLSEINRIRFEPYDKSKTPIMIANFGVHPEGIGVADDSVMSADFIPYMEAVINDAGYDFVYLQGAIGEMIAQRRGLASDGLSLSRINDVKRYGEEFAYFTLGMTYTKQECIDKVVDKAREKADLEILAAEDKLDLYTPWYENWTPVKEEKIEPILNIAHEEIIYKTDNPVMKVISKFEMMSNTFLRDRNDPKAAYVVTEVGYLEIGKNIKVFMCPGETSPDIIQGGHTMNATTSMHLSDFKYKALKDIVCTDENTKLMVFDLMNDAAGYIMPDNDYSLIVLKVVDGEFVAHTTALMYSFGKDAASTFVGSFLDLSKKAQ